MLRATLLVLVLTVAVATPARAGIKIDHSIAGVTMGMKQGAIRAKLGKPDDHYRESDPAVGKYLTLVWLSHRHNDALGAVRLYVSFGIKHGKVQGAQELGTSSRFQRTPGGVGFGTTVAKLRARVHGLFCINFDHFNGRCETKPAPGSPAGTRFDLGRDSRHGPMQVTMVRMAKVITRPTHKPPPPPPNPNIPTAFTVTGSDGSACPCHAGDPLEFDASAPQDPSHALPIDYAWDMGVPGDPSAVFDSGDPDAEWSYATPGTYHVTLVITDEGGQKHTLTQDVVVVP